MPRILVIRRPLNSHLAKKFPNLDEEDQEAVRQHAVAVLNLVQQAKKVLSDVGGADAKNTALIDENQLAES